MTKAEGLMDKWTTLRSAARCELPTYPQPHTTTARRVVPFSIVKWFPFRVVKVTAEDQSGSLFDCQMVPF